MLKNKKWFVIMLTVFMSMSITQFAYARDVKVFFNGTEIRYSVPAQIIASRTMVPLSQTFEALVGSGTSWNNATRTSTFYANGHKNEHTIGTTVVYVDGVPERFDTPSVIIGDRALVPIRMIAETSGLTVEWDPVNYYVLIKGGRTSTPSPTSVPTPRPTPTPTPQPAQVSIISTAPDKTTINFGDSVTFSIRTNVTANNVWINSDGNNTAATYQSTDASNIKTWTVRFSPSQSQNIKIYANTTQVTTGATARDQYITVNSASAIINNVYVNPTTVTKGNSTVITATTNAAASYVWADIGRESIQLNNTSTDSSGKKTWTASYQPNSSATINVSAGRTRTTSDNTKSVYITVETPADPSTRPVIYSFTSDSKDYYEGDNMTFYIETNDATESVYVSISGLYGGTGAYAFNRTSIGSSRFRWTAQVSAPYLNADMESTTLDMNASAANSRDSLSADMSTTVNVSKTLYQ